jgi:DNA-directed RNA polymerase II subunit RPB1
MATISGDIRNSNVSKIIGIQFSIMSPEEILKGSVAEITNRETYVNNKPVIGGLFDPRMGPIDPGVVCPTDGLDYMKCPGYFGHIKLARPVFYYQYLGTVLKILRCVCIKCSALRISKSTNKQLLALPADERWVHVFRIASKIKRCGEDTETGCGCLQPKRITMKAGLGKIYAEWDNVKGVLEETTTGAISGSAAETDKDGSLSMKLTPEIVIKIFRRISDEDVEFMGFSPVFSRPDWMVCQVLAIPPPAVRPSVKMDGSQRSEDDITHIIVNIIKANTTLLDKMNEGAPANVIDGWHMMLQYYVATQVNNNIPGCAPVAQRSGRPLKSIQERLNGKGGRVRGNLMGKRVDFSARSVITPDPNLSIRELGIPLKIAKNITKPVVVNDRNKKFLLRLVRAGPDEYPGAKILERKTGESISLRYADRANIMLNNGDIVHRHMMDGDAILFNRQPTLHRMSMMCHIARVMYQGDTFRMNVGCTKPYNADFDGDEMNLHMPQDDESEIELRHLAAVPYQLISPANNNSIIGVFQDSLIGSYLFTRENIRFTPREAMNLLAAYPRVNETLFKSGEDVSNFDVISQILPPLTLKYKKRQFGEKNPNEDYATSNNVVEIRNGRMMRGQIDKSVLGGGGVGLIQRVCNDFGNIAAADFIDGLQNIITEYMKSHAYSVGISDLIANKATNTQIVDVITKKKTEVKNLIDQVHLGIFENKTGKSNEAEFEAKVSNILNTATSEAGGIGTKSLNASNRFIGLVLSGSKGSDLNISQMISCLGQQAIEGKRISYGFDSRTLPHFNKFDDGPLARGFIESSFISGLSPEELFFHAMGGRIGLIDTAVKTSTTGYIQRRLIKGLEDLKVEYDMTVRNGKQRIVQFAYGDDGIDTIKVENQSLPLVAMSLDEIYAHFHIPLDNSSETEQSSVTAFTKTTYAKMKKEKAATLKKIRDLIDYMIDMRDLIIERVFNRLDNKNVQLPVSFTHIIHNVQAQQQINQNSMVDITPIEAMDMISAAFRQLENLYYTPPTLLFKVMYYYYLSPKELLLIKRFNRSALTILLSVINLQYKRSIVAPGEMVGMVSAQSIGEPTTQLTLNTFHSAGVASKSNATRGVPRIEEILSLSENPKNPSITIYFKEDDEGTPDRVQEFIPMIEHTKLSEVVETVEVCFDPDDLNTLIEQDRAVMSQYQEFEKLIEECVRDSISTATAGVPTDISAGGNAATSGGVASTATKSKWIIRIKIDAEAMLDKKLTMDDIHFAIKNSYGNEVSCAFSDYNDDHLVFRLRMENIAQSKKSGGGGGGGGGFGGGGSAKQNPLDQSDHIYMIKSFQDQLLNNIVLRGVKGIKKVMVRKIKNTLVKSDGVYTKKDSWVLDTMGTNLVHMLGLDYIDTKRTVSNDIQEVYRVFGIEAARQAIYNELAEVFDDSPINYHHVSLLCDRMTVSSSMISIFRHGINSDDIGPLAKASFEETPEMFLKAARHAELDPMRGISANVMCGQEGYYGTSAFQVLVNMDEMMKQEAVEYRHTDVNEEIEDAFKANSSVGLDTDKCGIPKLAIQSCVDNVKKVRLGKVDDGYDIGF